MWDPTPLSSDNKQNTGEFVAIDDCKCSGGVEELSQLQQQKNICSQQTTFGSQLQGSNKIPQRQKDGVDELGDDNKKFSNSAEETADSGFLSGPQNSSSAILDTENEAASKVVDDIKKLNITESSADSEQHYKTQQQQRNLDSGIIEEEYDDIKSDLEEKKNQSSEQNMILPHSVDTGISEWFCKLSLQNNTTSQTNASSGLNNLDAPKQQQSFVQQTNTSYAASIPQQITPANAWEKYYQQNDDGDTPLHLACISGYEDVVAALIRMAPHPCLFNIQNDEAQTPLHLATLTAQPKVIRMLLIAGAKPTVRDRHGNTALHLACISGEEQCVRALTIPISVSEINEAHRQHGHRINEKSYLKCSQLPSDLEIRNYDGERCVHLAAQAGFINILRLLVFYGADINAREGKSGLTPLHIAIESCNGELINYLLDDCQKLNLEMATYAGLTAYQVACILNRSEILNILEKRGAEPLTPPDSDYESSDNELDLDDSKSYDRFGDPNYFVGYKGGNAMTVA